jgi:hypothetical protein
MAGTRETVADRAARPAGEPPLGRANAFTPPVLYVRLAHPNSTDPTPASGWMALSAAPSLDWLADGKQASVIWAGLRGSRWAWRACAFCESARQHAGAGWPLAALAFPQIRLRRSASAGRWIAAVDAERCLLLSIRRDQPAGLCKRVKASISSPVAGLLLAPTSRRRVGSARRAACPAQPRLSLPLSSPWARAAGLRIRVPARAAPQISALAMRSVSRVLAAGNLQQRELKTRGAPSEFTGRRQGLAARTGGCAPRGTCTRFPRTGSATGSYSRA